MVASGLFGLPFLVAWWPFKPWQRQSVSSFRVTRRDRQKKGSPMSQLYSLVTWPWHQVAGVRCKVLMCFSGSQRVNWPLRGRGRPVFLAVLSWNGVAV